LTAFFLRSNWTERTQDTKSRRKRKSDTPFKESRKSRKQLQCQVHPHNQEVVVVEEAIEVVEKIMESAAEIEDVVVLPPHIHGANVDTTMIQKLLPTHGRLEGAKINLITKLERNPRKMVQREEGDVVVHEKNLKGCVGVTNNNKKDLSLLKIRKKDVKKESHMSQSLKLRHQLAATEETEKGVEGCVAKFNHHLQ